ncbi:MAG: hypothetical protein FJ308_17055, partial [Planctomycetes bacterium]|nr:hypothetical protein [Planctomycetota bacterium]
MHSPSDRGNGLDSQGFSSRRALLQGAGMGMGLLSLGRLLGQDPANPTAAIPPSLEPTGTASTANAQSVGNSLRARPPHFAPRAKRMIHFFLNG